LAVCSWPLPRAGLIDPAFTLGGLRRRLRPGGVLTVIAPAPPPGAGPAELGPAVRAAATAGLCYLQHIVAMHAAADGEDIAAAPAAAELTARGPAPVPRRTCPRTPTFWSSPAQGTPVPSPDTSRPLPPASVWATAQKSAPSQRRGR
jgi:hypothetical protein